ncbi:MAG TPA: hypothetical protein VJ782_01575 [Aeromicrobium sp.]|nr:hypothetical protein [Aeromicrobium sp.]
MPLISPDARLRALRCTLGPDRAAIAPASFTAHLFTGDPMSSGVEIADETEVDDGLGGTVFVPNGYAPVVVDSDDFAATADFGMTVSVQFPDSLEAYPAEVTHWALFDPVAEEWWDSGPLFEPEQVTGAGSWSPIAVTVFYDDDVEES